MLVGAPVIEEILHPPPRCLGNNAPTSAGTRPPAQVEGDIQLGGVRTTLRSIGGAVFAAS